MPLDCCMALMIAGFRGEAMLALAYREAVMRVRRCVAGAVNWRDIRERRARLKLREAMLDV